MTLVVDDFSPIFVGDTSPLYPVFQTGAGVFDLTGLTGGTNGQAGCSFTMTMHNQADGSIYTPIGTWSILDGPNGKTQFTWNAADTATASTFVIVISIAHPTLGEKSFSLPSNLVIATK